MPFLGIVRAIATPRGICIKSIIPVNKNCLPRAAWNLSDLSICLNAWCFERNGKYNNQKGYSLLKAYNTLRPLHYEEYNALPILARGSALRFVLTRLYDKTYNNFHTSIRPKDPSEFLDRLKFHQRVQRPEVYGLEEKHIKK